MTQNAKSTCYSRMESANIQVSSGQVHSQSTSREVEKSQERKDGIVYEESDPEPRKEQQQPKRKKVTPPCQLTRAGVRDHALMLLLILALFQPSVLTRVGTGTSTTMAIDHIGDPASNAFAPIATGLS